jgi:signal transduction histidine kinase
MKPFISSKFSLGGLTALFFAVAVVSVVALVWMGISLMQQDRALEKQRLEELREVAANRFIAALKEAISAEERRISSDSSSDFQRTVDDVLLVIANSEGLQVWPEQALLYHPVLFTTPEVSSRVFANAEEFEFRNRNFSRAIDALRPLLKAKDAVVKAGAQLRVARNFRKLGQHKEALKIYGELAESSDDDVSISGVPVDLIARLARCKLLNQPDRRQQLQEEASSLQEDLQKGRWSLDRASYYYYTRQLEPWLDGGNKPDLTRQALAEAVAEMWHEWRNTQNDKPISSGSRCLCIHGVHVLVIWRSLDDTLKSLVLGPRYQLKQWFDPLLEESEFRSLQLSVADSEEVWVVGDDPLADEQKTLRLASVTGLPWQIALSGSTFKAELEYFTQRRQLMMAGLGILVLFVLASSYLTVRGVSRTFNAARLQSDFVSAVSHEFRTPLTSMRQFTEMLLENDNLPSEKRREFYRAQERSTRRLSRLVESLLDFGRMEAGARPYRLEPLDAGQLVRTVVEEFREEALDDDFSVDCAVPDQSITVNADREALSQVMWDLLDNAVKYSGDGKKIEVEVKTGKLVTIQVRDQGVGIQLSEQEQIFRKFTRGSSAKTLGIKGTGIGLAMVKHIVNAHGGKIIVESEPGKGSTFTILLAAGG